MREKLTRAKANDTSSSTDQSSFATRTAAAGQIAVLRILRVADDVWFNEVSNVRRGSFRPRTYC